MAAKNPDWPLPFDAISPSSMANFQRCPEQWRRKYVLKDFRFDASVSSILGNAVHGAAETNYRQKATTGADLSPSDVDEAYAAKFEQEVDAGGGASEINWTMRIGKDKMKLKPGEAKDRGLPLSRLYRQDVSPRIQPIGTEEWFRISVPGVPIPVRGKIDLITETKKADLKFSANLKTKPDVSWRLQALTYMLVDQTSEYDGTVRLSGLSNHDFEWQTGTFGGVKNIPKIMTVDEEPALALKNTEIQRAIAEKLIQSTVSSMLMFWNQFGPDEPWPGALNHTWACDFCNFNPNRGGNCFWWAGPQAPNQEGIITLF